MKGNPGTNCTSSQWGQILARAPESIKDFTCHQEMACIVSNTQRPTEAAHNFYSSSPGCSFGHLVLPQNSVKYFLQLWWWDLAGKSALLVSPASHTHLLQTSKLPNNASGSSVLWLSTKSQILLPPFPVGKSTEHILWSSILLQQERHETLKLYLFKPLRSSWASKSHLKPSSYIQIPKY